MCSTSRRIQFPYRFHGRFVVALGQVYETEPQRLDSDRICHIWNARSMNAMMLYHQTFLTNYFLNISQSYSESDYIIAFVFLFITLLLLIHTQSIRFPPP